MESFDMSWKFEKHMTTHTDAEKLPCNDCSKTFYMKWRLNKHKKIHDKTFKKKCHYFNNHKDCPYIELGCKFIHEFSEECHLNSKCLRNLCPNQHPEKKCALCETKFRIENGKQNFKCGECDNFVCKTFAKETHISDEYFTCSPCLL